MPEIVGGHELIIEPDTLEARNSVLEASARVTGMDIIGDIPDSFTKGVHFRCCTDWAVPTIVVTSGEKILFAPPLARVENELSKMQSDVRLEIGRVINNDVRVGVNDEVFGQKGKEKGRLESCGKELEKIRRIARSLVLNIACYRELAAFAGKNGVYVTTFDTGFSLKDILSNVEFFQERFPDRWEHMTSVRDYILVFNRFLLNVYIRGVEAKLNKKDPNLMPRFRREHPEFDRYS